MLARSSLLPKLRRSFGLLEYYGLQKRFEFIWLVFQLPVLGLGRLFRAFGLAFASLALAYFDVLI